MCCGLHSDSVNPAKYLVGYVGLGAGAPSGEWLLTQHRGLEVPHVARAGGGISMQNFQQVSYSG